MVKDKKEYLINLSVEGLIDLSEKLLPNMGIFTLKRISSNSIEAIIDTGKAGKFTNCYIVFSEQLSRGYYQIDNISELIDKRFNSGYSKVYIINNHTISNGFEFELEKRVSKKNSIIYWQIENLLKNIEENYPEFWRHSDQALIAYETHFEDKVNESFEIKKLVEYKAAYQKLLSIFIEPNLFLRTEDKQSSKKAFTKVHLNRVIDENERLLMLHGDPGTGKTRLLNEIGKLLINRNSMSLGKRYLPVFIDSVNLRDALNDKDDIDFCSLILTGKLDNYFTGHNIEFILSNYQLTILVDSIDEFEEKYKSKIIREFEVLMDKGVLVFIGTRSNTLDDVFKGSASKAFKEVYIQKFNDEQVEKFAERYFEGNGNRAQSLIESMKENKILEKLPLTPLNLSLMSILYEETNQEIPSTLNDIYDKFSNLLLGRTMVNKNIDFLDITIKENILGIYALELLKRKNSELMSKEEFISFFKQNLSSVSGTINLEMLPQALDFIIEHTGLLILYKNKYVKFRHDSYMEYFAAKEIFKNHREMEDNLVDNFFDVNWQFAAVFYGGLSRKMPVFLTKIIEKISKSNTMKEYWSSANGMGYLLQALYLTDDEIRAKGIKEVLKLMVETYEGFKKFSTTLPDNIYFSRFSLPVLSIFPIFLFQDSFDSITLKMPLSIALDELLKEYDSKKSINDYPYIDNIIYRILILSITMSSSRLVMEDKLLEVIGKIKTTGNEFYTKLLESAIDNLGSRELRRQKNELLKPIRVRNDNKNNFYIRNELDIYLQPASRHRFSKYDKVTPNKRVKLFVEGPTDAMLLEHAYFVLTGYVPYWEIKVGDPTGGGANSLAKALNEGLAYLDEDQIVIGIFDNDQKGLSEFKGTLHSSKFDFVADYTRIKKRKDGRIFGVLLPIPENMQHYIQSNDNDNYFTIEHYFNYEYLEDNSMLKPTAIPGIFKINESGGAKTAFAKKTLKNSDRKLFQGFIILFKEIDRIVNIKDEIIYKE